MPYASILTYPNGKNAGGLCEQDKIVISQELSEDQGRLEFKMTATNFQT